MVASQGEQAEECSASSPRKNSVQDKANKLYRGEGLAPMVRASTTPLRTLALKYGADFVYSEELVDRSILDTTRVVNKVMGTIDYNRNTINLSKKKRRKLGNDAVPPLFLRIDRSIEGGKFIFQLGSGEPAQAAASARHVEQDVDAIDINMGCPKKFSVSGGMGSALLSDPDRACAIVKSVREAVPSLPVSAKIRLLATVVETVDFLSRLVAAGANAVAVHGRRVGDEATKPADWESLRAVVLAFKAQHTGIPILVNGDFYTRKEFQEFMATTKANGVLLARPALYNTSIFIKPPKDHVSDGNESDYGYGSKLLLDKTKVVQDYLCEVIRYDTHYKNVKYVVCEFMSKRRTPTPRTPFLPQEYPGGQTVGKTCDAHSLKDVCRVWDVEYDPGVSRVQQQQDEHKYLDSYFLDHEKASGNKVVDKADNSGDSSKKRGHVDDGTTTQ